MKHGSLPHSRDKHENSSSDLGLHHLNNLSERNIRVFTALFLHKNCDENKMVLVKLNFKNVLLHQLW